MRQRNVELDCLCGIVLKCTWLLVWYKVTTYSKFVALEPRLAARKMPCTGFDSEERWIKDVIAKFEGGNFHRFCQFQPHTLVPVQLATETLILLSFQT